MAPTVLHVPGVYGVPAVDTDMGWEETWGGKGRCAFPRGQWRQGAGVGAPSRGWQSMPATLGTQSFPTVIKAAGGRISSVNNKLVSHDSKSGAYVILIFIGTYGWWSVLVIFAPRHGGSMKTQGKWQLEKLHGRSAGAGLGSRLPAPGRLEPRGCGPQDPHSGQPSTLSRPEGAREGTSLPCPP